MSSTTFRRSATTFAAAALLVSTLAGCGAHVSGVNAAALANANAQFSNGVETEATSTLMKGFDNIHKTIFALIDKDKNNNIDEYEAGKNLSLADFKKADNNANGALTYAEFKKYAITNLFFFHDSATAFTSRFRSQLGGVFKRLDTNHDGVLQKNETSLHDLKKLGLTFEYPRLNIKVKINKIDVDTFSKADKTGDKVLSQAEFEDLYVNMVIIALGGNANDGPPAGEDPTDPSTPDTPPGGETPTGGNGDTPPAPAAGGDTPAPGGDAPPAPEPAPKASPKKKK